MSLDKKI